MTMRIGHWGEKYKANAQLQIALKKLTVVKGDIMFTTGGCKTLVHLHGVGHQEHKRFQEQT